MKNEVKIILKERGKCDLFTEDRYGIVKELMKLSMKKDKMLRSFLSIDPYYKTKFIADHIIKLTESKQI
jgi:hypothetical protein